MNSPKTDRVVRASDEVVGAFSKDVVLGAKIRVKDIIVAMNSNV